jgi:carboxyl-terminal processing protease
MGKTCSALMLAISALLTACGGGGGGSSATTTAAATSYGAQPTTCSQADQRSWLKAYMADQYFWNANLAAPNEAATTTDAYFRSLLFTSSDRFSYTQPTAQYNQFFAEGTRTGYGYSLAYSDTAQTVLQVRFVEPLSPVGVAGLQRGDTIVAIDGFTPAQITSGSLAIVDTVGVARSFSIKDVSGMPKNLSVASANYALTPVFAARVLAAPNGAKVGYLGYQEFISSSAAALGAAFDAFRAAGVTELIVDLRYNGGGSVATARNLASMMGGAALSGQIFAGLRFNANNSASNFNYLFAPASLASLPALPLEGLGRVFVIASSGTASASELVINSLKPFRSVVTVGSTTYGKPYGFVPREACGTTYSAVNFDSVNAQGVGGYTSGLPATCAVTDDLGKALGDPAERRIAAALSYIETGVCPPAAAAQGALKDAEAADQDALRSMVTQNIKIRETAFGEIVPPRMIAD